MQDFSRPIHSLHVVSLRRIKFLYGICDRYVHAVSKYLGSTLIQRCPSELKKNFFFITFHSQRSLIPINKSRINERLQSNTTERKIIGEDAMRIKVSVKKKETESM